MKKSHNIPYIFQFGGNPVSSAIALKVLDVMEKEKLQENATIVGDYLIKGFNALKEKYSVIGDVRYGNFLLKYCKSGNVYA